MLPVVCSFIPHGNSRTSQDVVQGDFLRSKYIVTEAHRWQLALKCIEDKGLLLTRRSAGIPAIITGVAAAYVGDKSFDDMVMDLQAMANAPTGADLVSLPQVHALNCLKDIFTDARFGLSTEIYVAESLEIAASCLESHMYDSFVVCKSIQ